MKLSHWKLYQFQLPIKTPFITHQGKLEQREGILLEVVDQDGRSGWGECVAFSTPFYTEETVQTAWSMLREILLPSLWDYKLDHPSQTAVLFQGVQGNPMAKASVEMALWDLYAKQLDQPLHQIVGGTRREIPAGVVISLGEDFVEKVSQYKEDGYKRYKLKVEKEKEYEQLSLFRRHFPDLPLMIDGNGGYNPSDIDQLQNLDEFKLMMIEQPFRSGDFYWHAHLQARMETPICLDESIKSYEDVKQAFFLECAKTINIKIGRVGGWNESLAIHNFCHEKGIPIWVGGMVETGISKAHSLALASLPGFTIPGDLSPSKRFWEKDVVYPHIEISKGSISLSDGPGIGYEIDVDYIEKQAVRVETIKHA